ncbi:transmembrane sensor [Variovorax boronicumulans]|uniref:FecR family protein n=1 Tax=Variovorax boronicumulans TaxID=436515 RepID=UPI0027847562|nr:FecR domain-containing protein [Variovorax boronicumulans]MDQ0070342.1 transmembrane sensor [Variovorax boronicumulans]
MSEAQRIETLAADWLARRDSGAWTDTDQQQLDAWITASIAHRVAWLRLSSAWERGDRLGALRTPAIPIPAPTPAPAPQPQAARPAPRLSRFSLQRIAAGVLVAVAGTAWFGWQYMQEEQGQQYATAVGARQSVALSDGSKLTLNTATQVRTAVNDSGRKVWLDAGEAYFDIAHDKKRPFVVIAGDRRITVLGTRFLVRRQGEQVNVTVEEGRVQIASAQPDAKSAEPTVLTRNQAAVTHADNVLVMSKAPKQVDDELSWREGKLVFDQTTLADAAAQFNRYNTRQLVIADPVVAQVRIGGSFDANNMSGFVALLKQGFGLAAHERGNEIRISN